MVSSRWNRRETNTEIKALVVVAGQTRQSQINNMADNSSSSLSKKDRGRGAK